MSQPFSREMGRSLDRWITGNYGMDQFKDDDDPEKCHVCGAVQDVAEGICTTCAREEGLI